MNKVLIAIVMTTLSLGSAAFAQDAADTDGLVKTKASVFKDAWVAPGVDFTKYHKIMLAPAEFEFREVKKRSRHHSARSSNNEFYIEERDREKLIEQVTKAFDEELAKTANFEIVNAPGEDVLILRGGLMDIVSTTPPDTIGASDIYVSSVGAATLVLEVIDSTTGDVLFRATDRKRIERPGRDMIEVNRVTPWVEVRRWAKRWASNLRSDLDSVHA